MADVVHRTTKQYRKSVNTPDFPPADWIVNPDLSAVAGFPPKYWNIVGDVISLMTQGERDAVDVATELARIISERDAAKSEAEGLSSEGIRIRGLVEVLVTIANYNATRLIETRAMVQELASAIMGASNLAQLQSAVSAIDVTGSNIDNARTRADLVALYKSIIDAGTVDS